MSEISVVMFRGSNEFYLSRSLLYVILSWKSLTVAP